MEKIILYPFVAIGGLAVWLLNGVFRMMIGLTGLQVFPRVSYFPGIAWNTVTWRWKNYQWYNRIDNTVVLGVLPFHSQTEEVRREDIVDKLIHLAKYKPPTTFNILT